MSAKDLGTRFVQLDETLSVRTKVTVLIAVIGFCIASTWTAATWKNGTDANVSKALEGVQDLKSTVSQHGDTLNRIDGKIDQLSADVRSVLFTATQSSAAKGRQPIRPVTVNQAIGDAVR